MKILDRLRGSLRHLRRSSTCNCFSSPSTATKTATISTIKNRLISSSLFVCQEPPQESDSLIAAAADEVSNRPSTTSRSTVVGTIFGRRRGHVSFCVQSSSSSPPSFLFEISMPTHLLAKEMHSALLRIVLTCRRAPRRTEWTAFCNGRRVGYAVRRRPTDRDRVILHVLRSTSAGAGVLFSKEEEEDEVEGEMLYMRATYEKIVRSKNSVSYHLINPGGGGGGGSPTQELSVFLMRSQLN